MSDSLLHFGSDRETWRREDQPLLIGRGHFTDDVALPGQAHGAFVRAQTAHADLRRVDVARALGLPGVRAVLTGRDLAAEGLGAIPPLVTIPGRDG